MKTIIKDNRMSQDKSSTNRIEPEKIFKAFSPHPSSKFYLAAQKFPWRQKTSLRAKGLQAVTLVLAIILLAAVIPMDISPLLSSNTPTATYTSTATPAAYIPHPPVSRAYTIPLTLAPTPSP